MTTHNVSDATETVCVLIQTISVSSLMWLRFVSCYFVYQSTLYSPIVAAGLTFSSVVSNKGSLKFRRCVNCRNLEKFDR